MQDNHRNGFTLIELLVVVAIISLLSSIVIASINDAREKATLTNLRQTADQIRNAIEMYKTDTGDYPENKSIWIDPADNISEFSPIQPYIKNVMVSQNNIKSFTFSDKLDPNDDRGVVFRKYDQNIQNNWRRCANTPSDKYIPWIIWFNIEQSNPSQDLVDKLAKYGFHRYVYMNGTIISSVGNGYFCLTHAPI